MSQTLLRAAALGALALALSAGSPVLADDQAKPVAAQAPASASAIGGADFNGVWRIVSFDEVIKPEANAEWTEEGLRRARNYAENYDESEDTPGKVCYHEGMPWMMLTRARNYPTEIYQSKDRVMVFHEGMDMFRHIRLDSKTFPENYVASQMGYAIAHWEGEELVIETRGMTATNEVSVHQRSEQARVIERWRLLREPGKNDRIEIKLTLEDPVLLKKPAFGRQLYERAEPGTVVGGYNCPQALWDDYVASIKEARESAKDKVPAKH